MFKIYIFMVLKVNCCVYKGLINTGGYETNVFGFVIV